MSVTGAGPLRAREGENIEFVMDNLVSGQLYERPPSQNPVLLNFRSNSILSHSRKRPAPVKDTFFAPRGCPLTRASTVTQI